MLGFCAPLPAMSAAALERCKPGRCWNSRAGSTVARAWRRAGRMCVVCVRGSTTGTFGYLQPSRPPSVVLREKAMH